MKAGVPFQRSRVRLTLIYSIILAITMVAMTVAFYLYLVRTLEKNTTASLVEASAKLSDKFERFTLSGFDFREDTSQFFLIEEFQKPMLSMNDYMFLIEKQNEPLRYLAVNGTVPEFRDWMIQDIARIERQGGIPVDRNYVRVAHSSGGGKSYVAFITRLRFDPNFEYLYIMRETTQDTLLIRQMRTTLLLLGIALLFVASFLGYLFAGKAMVPIDSAFRRLRDFTADASHELRTPLAVLNSSVEIIQEHQDRLPDFHRQVLHGAKEEVGRMRSLVDGLLTLARSDSGVVEMIRERFDLRILVREAIDGMRASAVANRIEVSMNDPDNGTIVPVTGDRNRIQQLIVILLDNAMKYNRPGGHVNVAVAAQGDLSVITVKDDGIGISQSDIPYLFERFYRADKSRSRALGGTGLGLAIAKWIVTAHCGNIVVKSEEGKGSTFIVKLPSDA